MVRKTLIGLLLASGLAAPAAAQETGCGWSASTVSFAGSDSQQASCLLRKVLIGGRLAAQAVPSSLLARAGQPYTPPAAELDRLIRLLPSGEQAHFRLNRARPVSTNAAGQAARYFVIHDTSTPYLGNRPFPANLDADPTVNRLAGYLGPNAKAHYFVNRRGEIGVGHDFAVPWRATKLELQIAGLPGRGRFLHIELVQPRRRDPAAGGPTNDRLSPDPGFGAGQYRTVALLYAIASARAGRWLVPAFHATLDAGIADAHDDPQSFDLSRFAAAVDEVLSPSLDAATLPPASAGLVPAGATARWGDTPQRRAWTEAAWAAVKANGTALWRPAFLPQDIAAYCPAYGAQDETGRQLFWVGLLSSLALFESNYDPAVTYRESFPDAQGEPVISRGLLQLSIESANGYGCGITDAQQLHDPATNIACAVRILNRQVPRGGSISARVNGTWNGAAAYWSPFRRPEQRADIAAWTAAQPYCRQRP